MRLYRLTKSRYAHDISGKGARLFPGRWNSAGVPVLYASASKALALAEMTMHIERNDFPLAFVWMEFDVPDAWVKSAHTWPSNVPPENPADSRAFGDAWVQSMRTPLVRVPSALFTGPGTTGACEWNAVINVQHPEVVDRLRCAEVYPFEVDVRYQRKMLLPDLLSARL